MELDNGVRLGLLHASSGDDQGVLCRCRRVLERASLCVVDATGRIVREAKAASELGTAGCDGRRARADPLERYSRANEREAEGRRGSGADLPGADSHGYTSCVVKAQRRRGQRDCRSRAPPTDWRTVETTAVLRALTDFGIGGAMLAQRREAGSRANDTFYKSRGRLVAAGKVRFDNEDARYAAVEVTVGPGPEPFQGGSSWPAIRS